MQKDSENRDKIRITHCGLTNEEVKERNSLLKLQRDYTRWFTKEEFNRLKKLSVKMFKNAGTYNSEMK